nr:hypothetical protein [Paenibacillus sp. N3.4]
MRHRIIRDVVQRFGNLVISRAQPGSLPIHQIDASRSDDHIRSGYIPVNKRRLLLPQHPLNIGLADRGPCLLGQGQTFSAMLPKPAVGIAFVAAKLLQARSE